MTPSLQQKLIRAARVNEEADFSSQRSAFRNNTADEPVLDAQLLRLLILGIRPPGFPADFDPARTIRWSIRGATVNGILDLASGRSPGGSSLPALTFTDCVFRHQFCAENAHLASLTLRNCSFAVPPPNDFTCQLNLRNLQCDDELLLDGLQALHNGDFFALDARNIRTGASLLIRNSNFQARPNYELLDISEPAYAINLRAADIHGDLFLEPRVKAFGGINGTSAAIGGSFLAAGLQATDGYDSALRIDILKKPFGGRRALILSNATVAGNVRLLTLRPEEPFQATGAVELETIQIHGNLFLKGVEITGTGLDQQLLSIMAGRVRGYIVAGDLENRITGTIAFTGLEVGADLSLSGRFSSLIAQNLKVDGNADITDLRDAVPRDTDAPNVDNLLDLTGTSIKGSLTIRNRVTRASLVSRPPVSSPDTLAAGMAEVIARTKVLTLNLGALTVGQGLSVYGLYSNLWAKDLSIENDLVLGLELWSCLLLSDAKIGGALDLSRFHFTNRQDTSSALGVPRLWLTNAEIKGTLNLGDSSSEDNNITFRRARIARPLCYPSLYVVEVEAYRDPNAKQKGETAWTAFLVAKSGIAGSLDGHSRLFRAANKKRLRRTRTDPEIADYFRLFCGYLWAEEGSFRILEDTSTVHGATLKGKVPQLGPLTPVLNPKKGITATVPTHILYGNDVVKANLSLANDGLVQMSDDERLAILDPADQTIYETPLRRGPYAAQSDYHPPSDWEYMSEVTLTALVPRWKEPFRQTASFANAFIDLQNASCTTLEDSDGTAWGNRVQLRLENFSFRQGIAAPPAHEWSAGLLWSFGHSLGRLGWDWSHRLGLAFRPIEASLRGIVRLPPRPAPSLDQALSEGIPSWFSNVGTSRPRRTGVLERLDWLEQRFFRQVQDPLQPDRSISIRENLLPQPYARLAKVFREQGDETAAKRVEEQRIRAEHWIRARESFTGKLFLPISGLFRIGFRYGLSPARAVTTFLAFLLLGWGAVHLANTHPQNLPLLTQNTQTASILAVKSSDGIGGAIPVVNPQNDLVSDLPCRGNINEFFYAADVFIPLLDLRQEARCDIRAFVASDQSPSAAFHNAPGHAPAKVIAWLHAAALYAPLWQVLKALYAILGWVITSLAILTFSGAIRKWDES